ncbi:MAG: hypothetical protein AAF591_20395 [Verrucomicrobiota bacterium]
MSNTPLKILGCLLLATSPMCGCDKSPKSGKAEDKKEAPHPAKTMMITSQFILKSADGKSILESGPPTKDTNLASVLPSHETLTAAKAEIRKLGFSVDEKSQGSSLTVVAPKEKLEQVFSGRLVQIKPPLTDDKKMNGKSEPYWKWEGGHQIPKQLQSCIAAVAISLPPTSFSDPN